jgi:hypothetical protein
MMNTPRMYQLEIGAPARLKAAREEAKGGDWRKARQWGLHGWRAAYCAGLSPGFNGEGRSRAAVWYSHLGPNFRDEQFADEAYDHIEHKGWYTNAECETFKDGSGLARGIVARLPHGRFLAGYWWGDNDERVYFADVYTDRDDAARTADEHARVFAEMAQEDNRQWQAARDLEAENESAQERLRECLALRQVCDRTRYTGEARELIKAIRERRERLATEFKDYQ